MPGTTQTTGTGNQTSPSPVSYDFSNVDWSKYGSQANQQTVGGQVVNGQTFGGIPVEQIRSQYQAGTYTGDPQMLVNLGIVSQDSLFSPTLVNGAAGGGGGGGYSGGYAAQLAAQRQALVDQRKGDIITTAEQIYGDTMKDLDTQSGLLDERAGMTRGQISQGQTLGIQQANQRRDIDQSLARQTFGELRTEARRAARATGGATSSGFLETLNRLDVQLQKNVADINTNTGNIIGTINLTAQQALDELGLQLNEQKAAIDSDRRLAARDRDQAKREAEFWAANEAVDIEAWKQDALAKAAASSSANQSRNIQSGQLAQYISDLNAAASGQIPGVTPEQVRASYAPILAAAGISPAQANAYGELTGVSPYGQSFTSDDKFLYGIQQDQTNSAIDQQNNLFKTLYGGIEERTTIDPTTQQAVTSISINPYLADTYAQDYLALGDPRIENWYRTNRPQYFNGQ